jgi:Flp pilus assembly protein TadG
MRPLIPHPEFDDADEGAVMIWVALMIVVLLGVGALVIDVGALLVERRQLQNGADAAALAVAQDCAEGSCGTGGGAGIAKQYADLNAGDDVSAIGSGTPCGVGPGLSGCAEPAPSGASDATGWVRVNTSTETPDGGNQVSFLLAPLISALTGKTVTAGAVAAWGAPKTVATLPFTYSICEFYGPGQPVGQVPTEPVTIYSKAESGKPNVAEDCERSPSGGVVEGGFGWLSGVSSGGCTVEITVGGAYAGSDPGNNFPLKDPCDELIQGQEVIIPLFIEVEGTGANAVYTIDGFVGFVVENYHFPGNSFPSKSWKCDTPPDFTGGAASLTCFQGHFTQMYTEGEFGGSTNYGVSVIKMVG